MDVALTTSFGPVVLEKFTVWTDEVSGLHNLPEKTSVLSDRVSADGRPGQPSYSSEVLPSSSLTV